MDNITVNEKKVKDIEVEGKTYERQSAARRAEPSR